MEKSTWRILLASLIISFGGGFQAGFQTMVMNPSEESFTNFINSSYQYHYNSYLHHSEWTYVWPTIMSLQMIGAFFGTFFVHYLLEHLGRKRSLYVTNIGFLIGSALQAMSKPIDAWESLVVGRLLLGVIQGIHLGLQPVYINEISPKSIRGLAGSVTAMIIEMGYFSSSLLSLPIVLGSAERWPYLFVLQWSVTAFALIGLPFLPESPKYLAQRGDYTGAERSLRFYGRTKAQIEEELEEVRKELDESKSRHSSITLRELFSTPYIRKGVFLGWMVIFAACYSGAQAMAYFSTSIMHDGGLTPSESQFATTIMNSAIFVGSLFSGFLLDKVGRRPILLSVFGVLILMNLLFITFAHLSRVYGLIWAAYANIGTMTLLMLVYGLGPSALSYLLTVELVPIRARSLAHSLAMYAQWFCFGTTSLIIYPLQQAFNEFSFLLHLIPLSVAMVYLWFALPETKNKSTLEIIHQLGYKSSVVDCEFESISIEETNSENTEKY